MAFSKEKLLTMYISAGNGSPKLVTEWMLACKQQAIEGRVFLGVSHQWFITDFVIAEDLLVPQALKLPFV